MFEQRHREILMRYCNIFHGTQRIRIHIAPITSHPFTALVWWMRVASVCEFVSEHGCSGIRRYTHTHWHHSLYLFNRDRWMESTQFRVYEKERYGKSTWSMCRWCHNFYTFIGFERSLSFHPTYRTIFHTDTDEM